MVLYKLTLVKHLSHPMEGPPVPGRPWFLPAAHPDSVQTVQKRASRGLVRWRGFSSKAALLQSVRGLSRVHSLLVGHRRDSGL